MLSSIVCNSIGEDIELEHLIDHPAGYKLFMDFLEKEHASENIQVRSVLVIS